MSRISPALAFHALTFGVKDTAMASFDSLPAADRWSLAFYTVGMRHDRADLARGEKSFAATQQPPVAATASRLSSLSDGEIDSLLAPQMQSPADRANAVAWLRRTASFAATPGGTFGEARKLLAQVGPAPQEKRHALAVAAYLDGIEPHEASLRARDPELATRIEAAFLDLRKTIDTQSADAALQQNIATINLLLDRATERRTGPQVAFVAALTIALREGLEAALLIAALLAFLRKSGRSDAARMVHLGWLAAIPLGLATWFVAGALVAGAQRELVEAIVTLVAAAMILMVSHWVLGRHEAKQWVGFLQRRVMALAPGSNPWPLFLLAFIAAYREAFEIVLFYRALLLDVGDAKSAVAFGAAAGAVAIALVVFILARLGKRLNPRPVMLASSVLLAALAVTLVGRGVRALQEGGYLGLTVVRFPDLSTIGIYPTLQGLLAQGATLLALFFPSLWERFGKKVPSAPPARPASQ
jgi:high-affinity iron transporter